jgi:4-hydroxy-L-threonine phosphate dehydrogenase PdxA
VNGTGGAAVAGRVLLTIGDPNGIGPEIAVKAASALRDEPGGMPVLVGDRFVIERQLAGTGLSAREFDDAAGAAPGAVDVIDVGALPPGEFRPGTVSPAAGAATVAYLAAAVDALRAGRARGIVGCPHSETAVNAAGIPFAGYPSLIARLAGVPADRVFLMLVGGGLRIVHVTLHESLSGALARLSAGLVISACQAAAEAISALGVASPRIGVLGINPHAGEGGLFGDDDQRVTVPAVESLRRCGLDADGPAGADVMLRDDRYDGFAAMYHDQGHVPVKLLAGRTSSALSIGAGLLFSSVGHGAAFDIAGAGVADPAPVIGAVRLIRGSRQAAGRPAGGASTGRRR